MKSPHCHATNRNFVRSSVGGLLILTILVLSVSPALAEGPSVPAIFMRDIKAPGYADVIVRPSALHYDRFHDEILVGDAGKNRILIFENEGVFKYEFDLSEIVTSPRDITVDPDGYIYVLGSMPDGPVLQKFDYDGTPLETLDVPAAFEGRPVELRYLFCDDLGVLHALDHAGKRVLVYGTGEDGLRSFPIGDAEGTQEEALAAYGSPSFDGPHLLVPVGNSGTVLRLDRTGRVIGNYGHFGNKPGDLTFPVAVETSPSGIVMVLDRSRYCVVCYTGDGRFLGEFGGRGFRAGWFLGPFLLAVPTAEKVVVGQVYRSRIQICALPRFIRDGALDTVNGGSGTVMEQDLHTLHHPHRRSSDNSSISLSLVGEFPSPEHPAQRMRNVTLSEVSQ